ncbi:cytochrome P450 [Streptomyces tanashiensis]|uniref:cytochrome P450 n=1 Tax=Streptomyces tanashiensis TaxID=67367 RepID=UPI0036C99F70
MSERIHHLTPDRLQDPEAGYAGLRDGERLPHVVLPGLRTPVRLVTRYEDVKAALTEPRLIRDRSKVPGGVEGPDAQEELLAPLAELPSAYVRYVSAHLAFFDGEEHARRRAPLTRGFTARRIAALRPFVEESVARLIGDLAGQMEADLLNEFAYPLATSVICELVGVEDADRAQVCAWIRDFAYGDGSRMGEGLAGIVEYVRSLIGRRKDSPADDLVTALLEGAREGGPDALTEDEIIAMVFLLINTGITPPALFLAHAVLALLDHPAQLARLRAEPELLGRAVSELLRHVTLLRIGASLYAAEDFTFAGTELRKGEAVSLALLAANHDPAVYGEAPGRLDITRQTERGKAHLAFGHGVHHCIGAALGNLVTGVVFDLLLVRRAVPELAVAREDLEFGHWPGDGFHLLRLPVRL